MIQAQRTLSQLFKHCFLHTVVGCFVIIHGDEKYWHVQGWQIYGNIHGKGIFDVTVLKQ